MSMIETGIAGMILLLFFFIVGMPVSFAFALAGVLGFCYVGGIEGGLSVLAIETFSNFSSYGLTVIPMFVFMGSIAFTGGISGKLFDFGFALFGRIRGGLALSSIVACSLFAAVCGSTAATAAAMGKVAIPEMRRYKYDDALATGTLAAAGSLGILIPPSSTLIIYAMLTEQSVGKLFIAGVLPGLLLALLFALAVIIWCFYNPKIAPAGPATTLRQKLKAFSGVFEMLILFFLVMGGLFTGWFTPTQAGAAGAASTLLIVLVRRNLTWRKLLDAFEDTIRTSCMIMVLIAGALIFSRFLAVTGIPTTISKYVGELPLSPFTIMALIVLFHFIGGTFMDSFGLILLTVPVLYPTIVKLGFDPVWYGIIIILIVEMGVISPPEGLNMWVVKSIVPDVPLRTIFKGVVPFCLALLLCAALLMAFPEIATFLPSFMSY
jgi:tripartite ATP-independent transporter DctM subunit